MMKQMRENTKIILWIVVVAFLVTIFAVWGLDLQTGPAGPQQSSLGRVNGVAITPQSYQSVYNQLASQVRASSPDGRITSTQQEAIRAQAWESIITSILTDEQIEQLGISVTDDEVLAYLRTAPPPEVQQYFVDENGNFDFAAYQNALSNPDADWTAVEQLARQRIPMIKLNQYLTSQVHVGISETRRRWEEENIPMVASYVSFSIDDEDVSSYTPSEDEIKTYYDGHGDDFTRGERAVIEYVRVPIAATDRDRADVDFTISSLRDQILSGDNFEDVARTYSEGPTASLGGETGFLGEGMRDPAVLEALAGLETEQVSEGVTTDDRVYLVKLLETKTDDDGVTTYRGQEIVLNLSAGALTIDSLISVTQGVHERATASGDLAGGSRGECAPAGDNGAFH